MGLSAFAVEFTGFEKRGKDTIQHLVEISKQTDSGRSPSKTPTTSASHSTSENFL
jgi:hypothetical protein